MPKRKLTKESVWVECPKCGHGLRNHAVLEEEKKYYGNDGSAETCEYHRFVQCKGCESFKYVISTLDLQDREAVEGQSEETTIVYPAASGQTGNRPLQFLSDGGLVPERVMKMYRETIVAFNSSIRTLAGGGLRAVVEAICLDKKIKNGNLLQKIDRLAEQNLLTKSQADLLHEERYLGNAALHELDTPATEDIEDGLEIVEGLINTIYILPSKAENLRKKREAKPKDEAGD